MLDFAAVFRHGPLLYSFVRKDIQGRYAGSLMGLFWTFVQPFIELLTYTFVFTVLLRVRFEPDAGPGRNALYLFCGLVPWFSHHDALHRCTTIIRNHGPLIRKVRFPGELLPAYVVLAETFHQGVRFLLLLLAAAVLGAWPSWHLALVIPVMLLQILFTLGVGYLLSAAQVFFKDVQHLVGPVLMIWLFLTPIFYPPDVFPKPLSPILMLNPLSHLVGIYRQLILHHSLPHWGSVLIFATSSIVCFSLGWFTFRRHARQFPDLV